MLIYAFTCVRTSYDAVAASYSMRHQGAYGCQIRKNHPFKGAHQVKICFCTKKSVFNRCVMHPLAYIWIRHCYDG
jgi:hypothetical protein